MTDQSQPTGEDERARERLQLVGVVVIVFASIGGGVVDKTTSVSNWVGYGVVFVVMMVMLVVGSMIMGRIEHRPARNVAMSALHDMKSDVERKIARLRRR